MPLKSVQEKYIFLLLLFTAVLLFRPASAQLRADFALDKSGGCSPVLVNFSNRTTGASREAQYTWDFNNGNTSSIVNPAAIFKEEKSFTVTLTVGDGAAVSTNPVPLLPAVSNDVIE